MLTITHRGVPETFIQQIVKSLNKDIGEAKLVKQNPMASSDINIDLDFADTKNQLVGKF